MGIVLPFRIRSEVPDTCLEVTPSQEENPCSMLYQMQPTDLRQIEDKHRTQGLQDTPCSTSSQPISHWRIDDD